MNKKGFTLAEVLITLTVIGVISAMTIPGLRKNADQREMVAGVKKAYSTLSNTFMLAEQENGPIKRWGLTDADTITVFNILKEHMNITKDCINTTGCLGTGEFYQLNGAKYTGLTNKGYGSPATAFLTADGMSWAFDIQPNSHYMFFVDVNGAEKKPNMLGQDVYLFRVYPDGNGVIPEGRGKTNWGTCVEGDTGLDCAARVLQEGTMNY